MQFSQLISKLRSRLKFSSKYLAKREEKILQSRWMFQTAFSLFVIVILIIEDTVFYWKNCQFQFKFSLFVYAFVCATGIILKCTRISDKSKLNLISLVQLITGIAVLVFTLLNINRDQNDILINYLQLFFNKINQKQLIVVLIFTLIDIACLSFVNYSTYLPLYVFLIGVVIAEEMMFSNFYHLLRQNGMLFKEISQPTFILNQQNLQLLKTNNSGKNFLTYLMMIPSSQNQILTIVSQSNQKSKYKQRLNNQLQLYLNSLKIGFSNINVDFGKNDGQFQPFKSFKSISNILKNDLINLDFKVAVFRVQQRDQETNKFIEIHVKNFQMNDGLKAFIINFNDLTEIIGSNYLENMIRFKSKIISSISHQLRTRLNMIQGITELMLNQTKELETRKYLRDIFNNCQIQSSIIASIITYHLIQVGEFEETAENIRVGDFVQNTISLFTQEAEFKSITLLFNNQLENDGFIIQGQLLRQIIINLLSNSLRFTQSGGKVTVQLSYERLRSQSIVNQKYHSIILDSRKKNRTYLPLMNKSYPFLNVISVENLDSENNNIDHSKDQSYFTISVRDNGIGFSQELIGKIMNVLQSESNDNFLELKKKYFDGGSFFIGVRSTFQIIKFINGYLSKEFFSISSNQLGSEVKVRLSIKQQLENSDIYTPSYNVQLVNQPPLIPTFSNKFVQDQQEICNCYKQILIVDDEPYNIFSLGFEVEQALNGQEALNLVKRKYQQSKHKKCMLFHKILMDYQMPVMDGIKATKCLLDFFQDYNVSPVTIIGCTAFSQRSDLEEMRGAGMSDILIKPVTKQQLLEKLKQNYPKFQSSEQFFNK